MSSEPMLQPASDPERYADPKRKWFALHAQRPWGYE